MIREETKPAFHFKQFSIVQSRAAMKLNTDGVLLGAWTETENATQILDIGTGTGILALMMAQKSSTNCFVTAVEIDNNSCLDASFNFINSPFRDRIELINDSIQNYSTHASRRFDLIISNPPYYTEGTSPPDSSRAQVKHTLKLSHPELLESVSKLLSTNGFFNLILPYSEGKKIVKMAEDYHLYANKITQVISVDGRPTERLLIRLSTKKTEPHLESLTIKLSDNMTFSEQYKELTKDFYLKFY